jgi:hypothetical protein
MVAVRIIGFPRERDLELFDDPLAIFKEHLNAPSALTRAATAQKGKVRREGDRRTFDLDPIALG